MLLIRAPLRVSFGGGGTDLPAFYERHGGLVVSAAIARYCYALVEETRDGSGWLTSADYGERLRWEPARLPRAAPPLALPKAALAELASRGALTAGVALTLASEAPPGSGLGGSSAMAVALTQALATRFETPLSAEQAAARACTLEIERLAAPIGKQDQYASAFGGLNVIEFTAAGVRVTPLRVTPAMRAALDERLLLFWTGQAHDSASILRRQRRDTQSDAAVIARLQRIKQLAAEMRAALEAADLQTFGHLLDDAWQTKRRLSGAISSDAIDEWYSVARDAGALGGKITGAGGGGFLLLFAEPQRQPAVRRALAAQGLIETPFNFDMTGVTRLRRAPRAWRQRLSGAYRSPEAAPATAVEPMVWSA